MVKDSNSILGKAARGIRRLGRLIALACSTMIEHNHTIAGDKIGTHSVPAGMIAPLSANQEQRLTLPVYFIIKTCTILCSSIRHLNAILPSNHVAIASNITTSHAPPPLTRPRNQQAWVVHTLTSVTLRAHLHDYLTTLLARPARG